MVVILLRLVARVDEHRARPVVTISTFVFWERRRELRQLAYRSLELFRLLLVLLLALAIEEAASVQELQLLEDLLH